MHTSMTEVGFELTIPVFERAKSVHALDRGATVIGKHLYLFLTVYEHPFGLDSTSARVLR
jgi:hypothetical protein